MKALKHLAPELAKEFRRRLNAGKGGSAKQDPIGSWLSEKTGGLLGGRRDTARIQEIVADEADKRGLGGLLSGKGKGKDVDLTPVK